jgi:hypothetical protein
MNQPGGGPRREIAHASQEESKAQAQEGAGTTAGGPQEGSQEAG